ncbi:hypothetical protein SAMIE_1015190 [Sphingobium amiense]|uniref:Uncharacterized protein n=1 Tax=Sphingobium amiense TaxID=135719 RepID=A0A494W4C3_9SPHN|nr:hypothetical protein [Sphingobium amiense]BBD98018.1 hypothetical protein SAMIE_1015190 [Sphingobium amiense]
MSDSVLHHVGKQVLRGQEHYADAATPEIAAEIVAMEQRALRAEELLSSMMKGGELLAEALGEAGETFGYLHACMFGAEQHLREHGWLKPVPVDHEERMPF